MNAALANLTVKLVVFRIRNFVQDAQHQPEICIQNLSYHHLGKIGKVSSQTFFTANNIPEQFLKGWLPFPNHHFGYPAVSFRECIPKRCPSFRTIRNRLTVCLFLARRAASSASISNPPKLYQIRCRARFWQCFEGVMTVKGGAGKKKTSKINEISPQQLNNMFWSCLHVDLDIVWETLIVCADDFPAREWISKFSMEPVLLMYQNSWLSIIVHPGL